MAGKIQATSEKALIWTGDPSVEGGVYAMRETLLSEMGEGGGPLRVDMAGRTRLHTSGLHLLLAAANTLRSLERELILINTGRELRLFLERLNVAEQFVFEETAQSGEGAGAGRSGTGESDRLTENTRDGE